ncbi:MAG: MarR family winged helix-turn-helix transcriptional regulator [Propionibacteriaceae bacterium]
MNQVNGFPDHVFSALDLALRTLREDLTREVARPVSAQLSGLRSSQLRLLSLVPADGLRVTDLAARVGMTKQALGEFASVLEARGLLESTGDPADRRVRRIRPTAEGLEVVALSDRAIREMEARWRERMGPERWDAMKQTLLDIPRSAIAGPGDAEERS